MRTHSEFISFAKLANLQAVIPVVTVALVCNDLAVANSAMSRLTANVPRSLHHVRRGVRMYFSRMQCGHLNEGMDAIAEVQKTSLLLAAVQSCRTSAIAAFHELCKCLKGGPYHKEFKRHVGFMRNRAAFHYDPNDLGWAIADRAGKSQGGTSSLTAGEDIHSSRFEFGDDLLDSVVCRRIWGIPKNQDVRQEADRFGAWCDKKCREYLHFGADFVPRFLKGRATI